MDGIEKRRAKWGAFGRGVYALSERLACVLPDALVTDAEVIRRHYLERYGAESVPIAYGVDPRPPAETGVLERLGLEPRRYFLYVSRFEPENNPHRVAEAYRQVRRRPPAGHGGRRAVRGRVHRRLHPRGRSRASCSPGRSTARGTASCSPTPWPTSTPRRWAAPIPALVEAMGYGNCVVVNDTPENREVAGGVGL